MMGILDSIMTPVSQADDPLAEREKWLQMSQLFNSFTMNPNASQGYYDSQQKGIDRKRESIALRSGNKLEAEKLKRHTAQALQLLGNEFPEISKALLGGFLTPKEAVNEMRNPDKGTSSMQEYAFAKKEGFTGTFEEYQTTIKRAGANSLDISVNGQTGTPAKAPDGMTNLTDKLTGITTQVPIGGGIVDINAQKAVELANSSIETINTALGHAGLNAAVGSLDSKFKSVLPDAVAFEGYHNQIKGKAFLAAFESLKGGGQITEIEGMKAEQATARLDLAQDEADYKIALEDLRDIIQGVLERNQRTLASIPTGSQAPSNDPLGIL